MRNKTDRLATDRVDRNASRVAATTVRRVLCSSRAFDAPTLDFCTRSGEEFFYEDGGTALLPPVRFHSTNCSIHTPHRARNVPTFLTNTPTRSYVRGHDLDLRACLRGPGSSRRVPSTPRARVRFEVWRRSSTTIERRAHLAVLGHPGLQPARRGLPLAQNRADVVLASRHWLGQRGE